MQAEVERDTRRDTERAAETPAQKVGRASRNVSTPSCSSTAAPFAFTAGVTIRGDSPLSKDRCLLVWDCRPRCLRKESGENFLVRDRRIWKAGRTVPAERPGTAPAKHGRP